MQLALVLYYFLYFASLGIFFPYFSLYLTQDLGLAGTQVGLVLAVLPLTGILVQPLWGQLSDLTGSRRRVLALVTFGTAGALFAFGGVSGFGHALIAAVVLAAFMNAVMPLSTAVSLATVGPDRYGHYRVWGTAGFLVTVVLFPRWMAQRPAAGLAPMFSLTAILCLAAAVVAVFLGDGSEGILRAGRGDWRRILAHPPVRRLLILVFATQAMVFGPMFFFPVFVSARGGDIELIGKLWVLMLLLEIPAIATSGRTLRRIGPRGLLALGLAAEAIRWATCAMSDDFRWIGAAMVLHGVAVMGILVGAPLYLERSVPPSLRSTGQTLVAMAGTGGGAILSTTVSGWLFEHLGPAAPAALGGSGAALLLILLCWILPLPYRSTP